MYQLGLFLHLISLLVAFFATGIVTAATMRLRKADTVAEVRAAAHNAGIAAKLHPVALLGLLLTGAYMTQTRWSWGTPWIDASIVALVLIGIFGGGILGSRERALTRVFDEAADGQLPPDLRARANDTLLLAGGTAIPFFVMATMWVMISKPAPLACAAILVAGALVGALVGFVTLPAKSRPATAAAEA
jgi:hypothetical protein